MTRLWLLDFDACKDISMDQAGGVDLACKAFLETDPYCPRPHNSDSAAEKLWVDFSERYLATAAQILPEAYQNLPGRFLSQVSRLSVRPSISQIGSVPTVYIPRRGSSRLPGGRGGGYPENLQPQCGAVRGSSNSQWRWQGKCQRALHERWYRGPSWQWLLQQPREVLAVDS